MTDFGQNTPFSVENPDPLSTVEDDSFDFDGEDKQDFVVLYKKGITTLMEQVSSGVIQSRDIMVMLTYLTYTDWRTGRCRLTIARLAEILNRQVPSLQPSVKRLKNAAMLVPITDKRTGEKLHIVNPFFLKTGSSKTAGYLKKVYFDAINNNGSAALEAEIHSDLDFED